MKTSIECLEDKLVATLSGELDTAAAEATEQALQPLFDSKGKDIIIDCTELEYIASIGLRILLRILKQAKSVGSRVVLKNPNDTIREVLDMTGLASVFEFE